MSDVDTGFPLDDATLVMLAAACEINPDSGHTELGRFLDMGSRVKSYTLIDGDEDEDGAVYFREYEEGYEPFSPQHVIRCLVAEIQRLRPVVRAAQNYRTIGLADPTSHDLPPAGSALDHALKALPEVSL